jgi:hypothetical protein
MGREKDLDRMRDFLKSISQPSHRRRPPPKRKGGGSEPVTVEPNRPKLGEGGAAAVLEYDR